MKTPLKNSTYRMLAILLMVASLTPVFAQDTFAQNDFARDSTVLTTVIASPQFFISLLAGILLAIGFQVLLTALSVATGVSAIGNIREKVNDNSSNDSSDSDDTPTTVKISSGLGVWTTVTASIALFSASALAVSLSLPGTPLVGITLGLVIWAAFFTVMAYLEVRSVNTLLGTLMNAAFSGIRQAISLVQDMFSKSQVSKVEDIAENTIDKVRNELDDAFDFEPVRQTIDDYVDRLDNAASKMPDADQLRDDFVEILQDVRIEEETERGVDGTHREIFLTLASEQSHLSSQDVKKMASAFHRAERSVKEASGKEDSAKKLTARFSNATEQEIDAYISKIETYLRDTNRTEINPEVIRAEVEAIVKNPQHAQQIIAHRAQQLDRETLVALLENHQKMDRDRAETVVSYVEKAISKIASGAERVAETASSVGSDNDASATTSARAQQAQTNFERQANATESGLKARLHNYLARTGRPEIQYDALKHDIEHIMEDPQSSPEVARKRLGRMDRETIIALLTANDKLSRQDIEKLTDRVYASRDQVIGKLEQLETETRRRIESTKQRALQQAENARQTAAVAAWWLFGTAVVSGVASAVGGLIATL